MKFEGKDINEVWDWRLSVGNPILYKDDDTGTWIIRIWANRPDKGRKLLKEIDTKISTSGRDITAIKKCYQILYDIRDDYALPDIEEKKEVVKFINYKNKQISRDAAS